jgi:hypothetical protein
MFINFILTLVLIIVLIEAFVILSLIKLIKNFLSEIRSIKGIQFGSLEVGEDAPLFREIDHRGEKIILKNLLSKNNVILLFLSQTCMTCRELIDNLYKIYLNEDYYLIIIFKEKNNLPTSLIDITKNVSIINAPFLFSTYQVTVTPSLFIIGLDGKVKFQSEVKSFSHLESVLYIHNVI